MKLDSTYFDSIRIKPRRRKAAKKMCEWPECKLAGDHKAPKGGSHDGEYYNYCTAHAREYNKSYNYFDGMNDEQQQSFKKESADGYRPTWRMGQRGASVFRTVRTRFDRRSTGDPFGIFNDQPDPRPKRQISNAARKAFDTLGLDFDTQGSDIKAKYKTLVKMHHPDANGGTREAEDRLIEIIQAYRYLRGSGFC